MCELWTAGDRVLRRCGKSLTQRVAIRTLREAVMVGRRFDDGTFTLDLCIPGQAGEAWEVVGTFVVCAVRVVAGRHVHGRPAALTRGEAACGCCEGTAAAPSQPTTARR